MTMEPLWRVEMDMHKWTTAETIGGIKKLAGITAGSVGGNVVKETAMASFAGLTEFSLLPSPSGCQSGGVKCHQRGAR